MDYTVISSSSPSGLSQKVNEHVKDGWIPVGSHQVVETHRQNRFSGSQHMDTTITTEYTQTMIKE